MSHTWRNPHDRLDAFLSPARTFFDRLAVFVGQAQAEDDSDEEGMGNFDAMVAGICVLACFFFFLFCADWILTKGVPEV